MVGRQYQSFQLYLFILIAMHIIQMFAFLQWNGTLSSSWQQYVIIDITHISFNPILKYITRKLQWQSKFAEWTFRSARTITSCFGNGGDGDVIPLNIDHGYKGFLL